MKFNMTSFGMIEVDHDPALELFEFAASLGKRCGVDGKVDAGAGRIDRPARGCVGFNKSS